MTTLPLAIHYIEVSLSFTSIHLHSSSSISIHLHPLIHLHSLSSTFIPPHSLSSTSIIHLNCVALENILTPPPPTHRRSLENKGVGGRFKGSNFWGVGGSMGNFFSKGWRTYDQSEAQKHTYIHCFETKVSTPSHWDEVNIMSFNVSVFLWVS